MLDKLINYVKAQAAFKKICIFFLVFATTLTVMGGNHDVFYGSGGVSACENTQTEMSVAEQGLDVGTMLEATKAVKLEEISSAAPEPKNSAAEEDNVMAGSKNEDGRNADDKTKENTDDSTPEEFKYSDEIPMSRELQEHTYKKCREYGLEYELILAIIWRESNFNVDAVHVNANGTRDNGIMQINDVNREWLQDNYGITDLMDPYQNIDAGTAMLGRLHKKYGSHNAMLAYQYGEGGMAQKLKQGITTSAATEKAYAQRDYYLQII